MTVPTRAQFLSWLASAGSPNTTENCPHCDERLEHHVIALPCPGSHQLHYDCIVESSDPSNRDPTVPYQCLVCGHQLCHDPMPMSGNFTLNPSAPASIPGGTAPTQPPGSTAIGRATQRLQEMRVVPGSILSGSIWGQQGEPQSDYTTWPNDPFPTPPNRNPPQPSFQQQGHGPETASIHDPVFRTHEGTNQQQDAGHTYHNIQGNTQGPHIQTYIHNPDDPVAIEVLRLRNSGSRVLAVLPDARYIAPLTSRDVPFTEGFVVHDSRNTYGAAILENCNFSRVDERSDVAIFWK